MDTIRQYIVSICDDCYNLKGDMCNHPGCVFIRRTMTEVGEYLDLLLIRPIVDGERLRLQFDESEARHDQSTD
jgi:hypothetical protein